MGRELNVRYVLEGSVQRSGNRLRVNVQLIDAETGAHLWAERFDKPWPIYSTCRTKLPLGWRASLVRVNCGRGTSCGARTNPNSMDLYFQGMAWVNKGPIPEQTQARDAGQFPGGREGLATRWHDRKEALM